MKKSSLVLALATAGVLVISLPAGAAPAATDVGAKPAAGAVNNGGAAADANAIAAAFAAKPESEFFAVLSDAAKELSALQADEPDLNKRIAAYDKFTFSEALRPRLKAVFGTDKPLTTERLPSINGRNNYRSVLKAGTHSEPNAYAAWSDLLATASVNKAGNEVSSNATMAALAFGVKSRAHIKDIRLQGQQKRGADGLYYGPMAVDVASVHVTGQGEGKDNKEKNLVLEDLKIRTDVQRRGKSVDVAYGFSFKSASVGENRVERVNFATRVQGIDAAAMAEMDAFARSKQLQQLAPDARMQITIRKMKEIGLQIVKGGFTLLVDDISGAWRGQVASLKGRIALAKLADGDLESPRALVKKLAVKLDLRVPLIVVDEFARAGIAKNLDKNDPDYEAKLAAALVQARTGMVDGVTKSGFVALEQEHLHTVIEFNNGVLTLNGKGPSIMGIKDGKVPLPDKMPKL